MSKHQAKLKEPTEDEREHSKYFECSAKSTTDVMIILDGEQCLFVQHRKSLPVNKKDVGVYSITILGFSLSFISSSEKP